MVAGERVPRSTAYFTGLDLGQAKDFTAIAVLERTTSPDLNGTGEVVYHHAVRHLERFALGTSYTQVCARLIRLFSTPLLQGTPLAVDQTGVGRPVVDLLRHAAIPAWVRPVTITGGHQVTCDSYGGWLVPKKDLVSTLQVLLQTRRLKVAPSLPEAQLLVRELMNFQVKITPATHEVFGTWRDGVHDDLVLAVALAAWLAERATLRLQLL
jgi:hypothetical protein